MPAIGLFSFKNALWAAAVAAVLLWAALSCWRPASGRLRFSQGRWSLQHGDQEWLGTLSLHLDLQSYLLVRFRPDLSMGGSPSQPVQHFLNTKQPWFHLEARHFNPLALPAPRAALPAWADVRRAVYFSLATALGDDTSEKPVR